MQDLIKLTRVFSKTILRIAFQILASLIELFVRPNRSKIPPIDDKILLTSASDLSSAIKSGKLASEKVVESFIKRIRTVNPIINAVVDEQFDKALKRARELDSSRIRMVDDTLAEMTLFGVPVTIKETISLEGGAFTAGLPSRASKKADTNSPSVEQLLKAGAIPIGLTNVPCMNVWWDSYNCVYGQTNNPYDLSRVPGGSSGGEGAILAAAGSVIGVGSDLAGSIRIPANFCGIFGHKPTPFTVSNKGAYPVIRKEQEKMRGIGPMARYATDLLTMLKVMTIEDQRYRLRLNEQVDLSKVKIYYCEDIGDPLVPQCDIDILAGLRAAVQHLESKFNVPTEKVTLDEFKYGLAMWSAELEGGRILMSEHPDGFKSFNSLVELCKCSLGQSEFPFNAILCQFIEKFGSKKGTNKIKYLTNKAEQLRERFNNLVGDDGILLMPTHPSAAPSHITTGLKFLNCAYTAVGNTLHAPITQCPLGMTREGLPFGLQAIAKPYNDRLTLALAVELDRAFGGWIPPARVNI